MRSSHAVKVAKLKLGKHFTAITRYTYMLQSVKTDHGEISRLDW